MVVPVSTKQADSAGASFDHRAAIIVPMKPGAAVVISQSIKKQEILAYGDLGPEAIRRYDVVDFPAIVCVDCYGNDTYKDGLAKYCKE